MEIHVLHQQGSSIRKIARDLGVSRNTVRHYLRNLAQSPKYPVREARPSLLDPFKTYIQQRIDAAHPHWIPATVLLRELKEQGYTGAIGTIKIYIRPFKRPPKDPVVRFETLPGKQLQVDFTTIVRGRSKIKGFVATLGYSRACFVQFSQSEKQQDWLNGIEEAFIYFGGVPQQILFDNAKCIMIERDAFGEGQHRWNSKLLELAKDYGFIPKACKPYRAKTKGKVERFNRYLKESFITPLAASLKQVGLQLDITVANARIGPWLEEVAHQRIHGTTGQKPQVLLDEERFELLPLPERSVAKEVQPSIALCSAMPIESIQHPLSVYDQLLEGPV